MCRTQYDRSLLVGYGASYGDVCVLSSFRALVWSFVFFVAVLGVDMSVNHRTAWLFKIMLCICWQIGKL